MKRLLGAAGTLPFVKTISRDKAAPTLKAFAERRFLEQRFPSGVDLRSRNILRPGRNQPPPHRGDFSPTILCAYHEHRLSGRDVVTRHQVRILAAVDSLKLLGHPVCPG